MEENAKDTNSIRAMFARIAPRYDLLNRIITAGQDRRWRQEAIQRLDLTAQSMVLDAGAGTGDLAIAITQMNSNARVVACDITAEMVAIGRERSNCRQVDWVLADVQKLPFAPASFGGVVSGFLLRNVMEVDSALQEQYRVLRQGGRIVSLDTSPPRKNLVRPFLEFYLNRIIPLMGRLIAGDELAYTYLPKSTSSFLTAEDLKERLELSGFSGVRFARRMFGTIAIHCGKKA
jgi:demethylmenaquinone methyltransferase/2-methoxy-6-polyprenyl-1,4-benzoquinol methylase